VLDEMPIDLRLDARAGRRRDRDVHVDGFGGDGHRGGGQGKGHGVQQVLGVHPV
jgi:hypothetical protein